MRGGGVDDAKARGGGVDDGEAISGLTILAGPGNPTLRRAPLFLPPDDAPTGAAAHIASANNSSNSSDNEGYGCKHGLRCMLCPEVTTLERLSGSNDGAVVTYAARTDLVDVVAVTPLPPNNNSVLLLRPPLPPTHCHSPRCPPPNSITAAATIAVVATGAQTAAAAIHAVS
jgi:hypothetical protein